MNKAIQELIDDHKDKIPDGLYLQLCNLTMKEEKKKKKKHKDLYKIKGLYTYAMDDALDNDSDDEEYNRVDQGTHFTTCLKSFNKLVKLCDCFVEQVRLNIAEQGFHMFNPREANMSETFDDYADYLLVKKSKLYMRRSYIITKIEKV